MAYRDKALETGRSALLGAMSGAGMSGGVAIVNSAVRTRTNRAEENEMVRGMQQWLAKRKTNSEPSYRIGRTENNEPIVVVDEDILEGVPEEKWIDTVKKNLKKKFPEGVKIRNDVIKINARTRNEITESEYSKQLKDKEQRRYADKFRATNNTDEILEAADNWIGEAPKHERKDNIVEFARGTVLMKVGRKTYRAEVDVATTKDGSMQLHDIVNMMPAKIKVRSQTQTDATPEAGTAVRSSVNGSYDSIPQTTSSSQENNNKSFAISRMLPRAGESGPILPTAKEEMEARERQRRANEAATETERTGILYGAARENIEMAGRISKAIGRDVVFYENAESGVENDDGYYDGRDGKIYINAKSKNALPRIIAHEMTHSVELADSYIDLFRTVIRRIQKTGGSIQEMRNEIKTRYENNGVKLSHNAQIDVEIMAEYIAEHLLTDEASITNLAKESPKSARGILRFLDAILAKLGNTNAQERVFVAKARALYAKALGETQSTAETESERMRAGSRTEATPAKTETSSETAREKHPTIRENILPTAAERFGNKTAETQEGKSPQSAEPTAPSERLPQSPTVPAPSGREPSGERAAEVRTEEGNMAEDTETAREAESRGAEGMTEVEAIVSENLRPEIAENAELMEMLRAQFGADGTAALARQIKAEVERTGTVGRFGVLFSDGGMAVEEALGANDGGRQYSISKEESNSVREQVNTHLGELNAMESVASIKSAGRNGLSKDGFRKKIVESLRSTGFKVDRQGLGLIQFTEREINNSLNYMQTEAEFAAYQALPKVLKRGIEIGKHENHKGREYGTITIAAPIEINGERANMAVVVKQTKGNRYKVHRVLTPEGGTFKMPDIKNAEPTTGGGLALKDTHARPISSTSKKSITNGNEFVNTLDENIQYAIIKGAEETEILEENAELMEMLRAQFGADGTVALARQIKAEVEKTGSVGRFGVLFSDGGRAVEEALGAGDVSNGGERQFSISKDEETEGIFSAPQEVTEKLSAQVDAWLSGKMGSSDVFDIGQTPMVLQQLGALDLPVSMSQEVMAKITGEKHNISLGEIKRLPQAIADPIMVFQSATVQDALVILTELSDKSGNDVVVAMHLNRRRGFNNINRISSAYGKNNIGNFISQQIEAGNLKYADKKMSQEWLRSRGLQLPKLNTILNSNNSILQKEDIVNKYFTKKSGKYAQNAENKSFSISEKQENGRQYSIGKEKGVANRSGKRYNKKQIRMNSQEHTLVKSAIMKKESGRTDGDVPTVDSVYAYDKYYLYEPTPGYDGIVFARFDPETDSGLIKKLERGLQDGTINDKRTFSRWTNDFRSGKRNYPLHNVYDENGQTSNEANRVFGTELGSNKGGHSGSGIRNQSGVGLETETNERQYAIAKDTGEETEAVEGTIFNGLPRKAQAELARTERYLSERIGEILGVPKQAQRAFLKSMIRDISEGYMENGKVDREKADALFEEAYSQGVVVNGDYFERYKHIKDHLRNTQLTISEEDRSSIPDFGAFRKSAFGKLRIVNEGGLPVDVAYAELEEMAPELFPEDITHPADQLQHMFEVADGIRISEQTLDEAYGDDADVFKAAARDEFHAVLNSAAADFARVKRYADDRSRLEEEKEAEKANGIQNTAELKEAWKELKKARMDKEKISKTELYKTGGMRVAGFMFKWINK